MNGFWAIGRIMQKKLSAPIRAIIGESVTMEHQQSGSISL